jgi:glucose/arabinose dehydrogenase
VALALALVVSACGGGETGPPLASVDLRFAPVADLGRPLTFAAHPVTGELFIGQDSGEIMRFREPPKTGAPPLEPLDTPIDLRQMRPRGRRQMLGLTFSPQGDRLFANLTDVDGTSRIERWDVVDGSPEAATQRTLFSLEQPAESHDLGQLAFGPDGYLYVAVGDGGERADLAEGAQDPTTLFGSLLRIDVSSDWEPAPGNPFDGTDGREEIWVYGVRNAFRFSFDRLTGELWIGDVGQEEIEEIHRLPAAGPGKNRNLGWNWVDGTRSRNGRPTPADHYPPLFEYTHDDGCAVVGGFVYRGEAIPGLVGAYVYSDYCAGEVRVLRARGDDVVDQRRYPVPSGTTGVWSLGEDKAGELYVMAESGQVHRLTAAR